MDEKHYRIEAVAKRTGLTKRAIRYYEDIELIKPIRTDARYRLYSEEDIEKILRIRSYRDSMGFTLIEIKDIFELELNIKSIFAGDDQNEILVENSIKSIETQIKLIEQKQETLQRVRSHYLDVLTKLRTQYYNK